MNAESSCLEAFEKEFDYLCRTLRRLGVQPQDVEDELQNIFLVLERKWSQYDRERPLRPYLFGIAFRVVATNQRRRKREVLSDSHEAIDNSPRPDEFLQAARARELVLRALEHVPLPRRAVLVMHDIDETPMREVAQSLAIPLFTGYSRLRKARREFEAAVKMLQGVPYRP